MFGSILGRFGGIKRNVVVGGGVSNRRPTNARYAAAHRQHGRRCYSSSFARPKSCSTTSTTDVVACIVGGGTLLLSGIALVVEGSESGALSATASTSTSPTTTHTEDSTTTLLNWSGTHAVDVSTSNYYEPESIQEVEMIVRRCHRYGRGLRPLGSALSPNGIGFSSRGMMKLDHLDQVLEVDPIRKTVRVQAGARVSQVIDALRPHGWTLPNLASIAEQQMGGFVQVGAHGTGALIAPMDHYVREMKLVTPARGTLTLSEDGKNNPELFHLAKVGLGCLGVVVELTMDIIPAHNLVEHTFVLTRREAREQLDTLLTEHKHMRYMWIPHTDAVVCVTNDPEELVASSIPRDWMAEPNEDKRFAPLRELLLELDPTNFPTMESMQGMGFGELRDALLLGGDGPLDVEHVKRVNQAEADFWKRSEGYQTKPSDQLLQFDCGGQQWVWEVCFSTTGKKQQQQQQQHGDEKKNTNDMDFMDELLARIEKDGDHQGIPAHAPIEQRWTASSSSKLSPAYYDGTMDGLFSWVGIIQYLPNDETDPRRRHITDYFVNDYCNVMRQVGSPYQMTSHWAKLERPLSIWKAADLQLQLRQRFGADTIEKFQEARAKLDPKGILSNPLIDLAFGRPKA